MVQKIVDIVKEYELRLQGMLIVPKLSFGRPMLREDCGPNRMFLTFLFSEQAMAMEFLKDVGLLRSKVQCSNCGRDMKWSVDSNIPEGFRWRCRRRVGGAMCNESLSIKHGSWFHQSHPTGSTDIQVVCTIQK